MDCQFAAIPRGVVGVAGAGGGEGAVGACSAVGGWTGRAVPGDSRDDPGLFTEHPHTGLALRVALPPMASPSAAAPR